MFGYDDVYTLCSSGGVKRRVKEVKPLLYQRNRRYISCPDLLPEGIEPASPSENLKRLHADPFMNNQDVLTRVCTPEDLARQAEPFGAKVEVAYRRLQRNKKFLKLIQEA